MNLEKKQEEIQGDFVAVFFFAWVRLRVRPPTMDFFAVAASLQL
jgi:hypothetical protein